MRVVARGAADSRVTGVVTLAVSEPVRLEAHVRDVVRAFGSDLGPGPMALTAELGGLLSVHRLQAGRHHLRGLRVLEGSDVLCRLLMASFALDARCERINRQL